ncbi:hypothetical protein BJL95_08830 [Methylomonas sp. LWB]|nr:hypothetical protein BJL95_08830 [Methylomonas sp. LWB]
MPPRPASRGLIRLDHGFAKPAVIDIHGKILTETPDAQTRFARPADWHGRLFEHIGAPESLTDQAPPPFHEAAA